ncbi:MAG: SDR family oxidoreductase [Solirubrobacterales bacterium]|nr:SDR family oxidoreductase [Solirubrobacterales bacterium]
MTAAGGALAGKTVLVTGATSGIGLVTAEALANKGARTILGARTEERAEQARRRVSALNEDVHAVVADLSSRSAVLEMAREVAARFDRLDVLINNAGIDVGRRVVTADGLELTFAVNYMAPFLLTNGLRGLMRASSPARVLNVASSGYRGGKLDFDDLQSERRFSGQRAYNNSKLALVLFTYELARRLAGSGVTANAVDPGFVRGTAIGRTLPIGYRVLGTLMWPLMASMEKGAETVVWAASDPSLADATGRYFKRSREISTGPPTHDEDLAQRLWRASERLAGYGAA